MSQDPNELVKTLADQFRQIKFGTGVVGKTSYAIYSLVPVWGIILWRLSENLLTDACLLVAGAIITGVVCWWVRVTQKFAEQNPSAALLEGTQLLRVQEIRSPSKRTAISIGSPSETRT
jgi:hypothetical protein